MKKLMILGASGLQMPLIRRAKERGLYTVVVSPRENDVGIQFADEAINADVRDCNLILRQAQNLQIDGIITDQTDIAVRSVAYVAEQMHLPGIGYETACLFTDKYKMREKLNELGIETLRYKDTNNETEALDFFDECNGEVIIKPVDSQGSRGVFLIESKEKLKSKFEEALRWSAQKEVLVEEVAHGDEYVVEGIAYDKQFKNLICGDTYYFNIPDAFSAKQRAFPTNADIELRNRIEEMNTRIITGFGLTQGITHSEYIIDKGRIILLEAAARGGGVLISSDLISLSTGLNTEDFLINIALGEQKAMPTFLRDNCSCCYLAFFLPVGVVEKVKGVDDVKALPYTHGNNLDELFAGLKTKPQADKTSRFFVTMEADDRDELDKRVKQVREILDGITVRCPDGNCRGPIWD